MADNNRILVPAYRRGMTKKEMIREILRETPDISGEDAVALLLSRYGVEMPTNHFAANKSQIMREPEFAKAPVPASSKALHHEPPPEEPSLLDLLALVEIIEQEGISPTELVSRFGVFEKLIDRAGGLQNLKLALQIITKIQK